ncbi:MAG: hypothetical protein R2710_25040 [Acidimicrobiales bacterium]
MGLTAAGCRQHWCRRDRARLVGERWAIDHRHRPEAIDATTTEPTAEELPTADEPLFVVPSALEGDQPVVTDASDAWDWPGGQAGSLVMVGTATSTGFQDVSSVRLVDLPPFGTATTETTIGGVAVVFPAEVPENQRTDFARPTDDGRWIWIRPERPELSELLARNIGVVDGQLSFAPDEGFEVLARVDRLDATKVRSTLNQLRPLSQNLVSVAVLSHPTQADGFVFGLGGTNASYETVEVRGHRGVLGRHSSPAGLTGTTLAWTESPGQTIWISAPAAYDVEAIAEGLQVVDEATWAAAVDADE